MAAEEKPYRLYRGGRTKGRVPLTRLEESKRGKRRSTPTPGAPRRKRKLHLFRWIVLLLLLVVTLVVAWAVASYLSFDDGMKAANDRVPDGVVAQLRKQDGLLMSKPTTLLVMGTDGSAVGGRQGDNRSDSIMLVHTDPDKHRFMYLSIPRDLQVEIPGYGTSKINAAFQSGGPALALRTVKALTGLPVNHVVFVDFDRFRELIDSVGGIDLDVAKPIQSSPFDCPYKAKQCVNWKGWRFEKGKQHMDGRRALVYARIRKNVLDPAETDFTRSRRQQQVIEATIEKVTTFRTAVRFPWIGSDIVTPLATDLDTQQALSLGWASFRADPKNALHCRLGGEAATVGGESVILGSEDNVSVIAMFKGEALPIPPPKGFPYAPGCTVGEGQ